MNESRMMNILLSPLTSEKTTMAADNGNYVGFKVIKDANKLEIKQAVEKLFEVEVDLVRTANVKGKARRFGRMEGRTKDWKKAYVKLKDGHDISFIETE